MKRFMPLCLLSALAISAWAQERVVSGRVTDASSASALPGVNVVLKGTTVGTVTDIDGNYRLNVPEEDGTLVFSFVGMQTLEEVIGERSVIDVQMGADVEQLTEVVVTALGISREKRSLGYSTQQVGGDAVSGVKTANYVNSLSGKVSGVQIRRNNNFGGSTNVLIRGNSSLTGNNQALFVIDGVPISNSTGNNSVQKQSGAGYDYGNLGADINPDDIESINILKGAAASALYGSRAANGVVMITTKKGRSGKSGGKSSKRSIGVTLSSAVTVGSIDRSTFPKYQRRYGAGYGAYYGPDGDRFFARTDIDGDGVLDDVVPLTEDASYGAQYDPNLMIFQWDALDPLSPNYKQATPWVYAGENGAISFFETPIKLTNSVSLGKGFEGGSFRLSYTNFDQKGLFPNSHLQRNSISLNSSFKLSERFTATGFANYIKTEALGRNSTGYNDNIMGMFRQWWQTSVNVQDLKRAYEAGGGRNVTWNPVSVGESTPIYWDNPYWTRYKNYQNDSRDRFLGIMSLDYKLTEWLHIFGRVGVDTYSELQEERRAVGSVASRFGLGSGSDRSLGRATAGSGYLKKLVSFTETNYDLMLNVDKDITDKLNVKGVIGMNIRRTYFRSHLTATNAGLNIPDLYSIQNTASPLRYPYERDEVVGVDGIYANASLGYGGFVFLDGTVRRDVSSTLPSGNNVYYYPSVSASFVFSRFIPVDAIHFGKFRINYATVGNSAAFDRVKDTYVINSAFNGASTSVSSSKRNADLKPEKTESIELGLEMDFLEERVGFDMSLYQNTTSNQILPLELSRATGYSFTSINAGEIVNKGIELSAYGLPYKSSNFSWRVGVNWTKNVNEVISLYTDESGKPITNYQLGSFSGGVTLNARLNEPYGAIQGKDFLYTENGQRIVDAGNGQYMSSGSSDKVIGNATPDWNAGITNTFSYKNLSLSFLIDVQVGGDIFSLDMSYGLATGLYAETDFINDLGNSVRNSNADGGGFINSGVNLKEGAELTSDEEDGKVPVAQDKIAAGENTERIRADRYGAWGYRRGLPNSAFVYDASYVKLREVALSYSLPQRLLEKTFLNQVSFSFVGSNLWIIHKNLPHADPESGLGASNLQGYTTGSLPTTRNFTFNVKVQF